MELKEITTRYLTAFESKKLDILESLFSDKISLRDWEVSAKGKEKVLSANSKIFDEFEDIKIKILNMVSEGNTVVAEINIQLSKNDKILSLLVVDVIEYDNNGSIISIRAYLGN
tara:strand:- start:179 stop:520 length:342 start_codon:yes stop_codon:yes gene_type:complete